MLDSVAQELETWQHKVRVRPHNLCIRRDRGARLAHQWRQNAALARSSCTAWEVWVTQVIS